MAESSATPINDINDNKNRPELLSLDPSMLLSTESIEMTSRPIRIKQEISESVIFIWFDPQDQSNLNLIGSLRAINHGVQAFNDSLTCLNTIQSSKEKVFFITSSVNSELISTVHDFANVEAIFILSSNGENVKGDFPKLLGVFHQQEELFRTLKEILDIFEQIQLESFLFEHDKVFIWSQLWREELLKRKGTSKKQTFIEITRQYYRDNALINRMIDELEKTYRSNEALKWCFHSPFPSRFLHHALYSCNQEQLYACRFLLTDVRHFFQQYPQRKSTEKVYRGMKLSSELLDLFKSHTGQLVCASSFFPCIKSRANALTIASISTYRTDLLPVLFKIDCDASVPCIEIADKYSSPLIVFDIYTAFRILYVNKDQLTIIKMKTANDSGKKIAHDYIEHHNSRTIQSLLDELIRVPMPPKPGALPPLESKSRPVSNSKRDSTLTPEEIKAQKCLEKGDIDRALALYQHIQPVTARILNAIGQISVDRKQDYNYALQCHTKALKMQEETGEDISDTLTDLGNVYHYCNEYDLAINCHTRALALRQSRNKSDSAAIAANLIGIANSHWIRQEYPEAIDNMQRALTLRESLVPPNKASIASTLAMLASIYQDYGNTALAIDLCTRALGLFESLPSTDMSILAELNHDLGTMLINAGFFKEAYHHFEHATKIYSKILPQGHPDRLVVENDLQKAIKLYNENKKKA